MELIFTKQADRWVAEFIAKARRDGARFTSVMPEGETPKKTYEERIAALEARLALLESQNK